MTNQNSSAANGKKSLFQRWKDKAIGVKDYITGGEDEVDDKRDSLQLLKEGLDFRPYIFAFLEHETGKKIYKTYVDENGLKTVEEVGYIPNPNVRIAQYDSKGKLISNISAFYEEKKQPGECSSIREKIAC